MSGPAGPVGPGGRAEPYIVWAALLAGILLVVFGPDTSLGLPGLAAGVIIVVATLAWWLRSEARKR